ncbi:MAG: hypothetical protein ACYTG3_04665 [Planctomycetota bacterium]
MRRRLAALGALLLTAACAATGPALHLPETSLPLSAQPPPPPAPPAQGPFESAASREVVLIVRARDKRARLHAWCRVGVWTTLQRARTRDFKARESWGRLGQRSPRLLARIVDQALDGIVTRLRPEEDGSLSFHVEVGQVKRQASRTVGMYHGQRVTLGHVDRRGLRFHGRAPARWTGAIARWGGQFAVHLGEEREDPPPRALHFRVDDLEGFVAGPHPMAETFHEAWEPAEPVHVVVDGVERMDFRLVRTRHAAGFRTDADGDTQTYGPEFTFRRDD